MSTIMAQIPTMSIKNTKQERPHNKSDQRHSIKERIYKLRPLQSKPYPIICIVQDDEVHFKEGFAQDYVSLI